MNPLFLVREVGDHTRGCSLNAVVAQSTTFPLGVNTRIKLENITTLNNLTIMASSCFGTNKCVGIVRCYVF
jgi:hypothetical protein